MSSQMDTMPLFYNTYLSLSQPDSITEAEKESLKKFRDRDFTKYYIAQQDPVKAVHLLSHVVKHSILKPQRLLADAEDYYVGIDLLTNTAYICYRDLLMIDIDKYKGNDTLNEIKNKLAKYPEYFFRIYSSRNGYHVFILNKSMDYKSETSIRLMYDLGCDFFYIVYTYLRGWSVRLNRKKGEDPIQPIYTWLGDVVKGVFFSSDMSWVTDDTISKMNISKIDISKIEVENILPDSRLQKLTDMHIMLTEEFDDMGLSSMPAP